MTRLTNLPEVGPAKWWDVPLYLLTMLVLLPLILLEVIVDRRWVRYWRR